MDCNNRTSIPTPQEIDPCNGVKTPTTCVLEPNALPSLGLGENSTQEEINLKLDTVVYNLSTTIKMPIQEEGVQVIATPSALNFVGESVTVSDVGGVATITITNPTSVDYISDVELIGQSLVFSGVGGAFDEPVDLSSIIGAKELIELTDVTNATPTNRNTLIANGTEWQSRPLVEADISDLSHFIPTDLPTDYGITLSTVAITNDYDDLDNLPTLLSDFTDDIGATDPILLDTYVIDLQNGDDATGMFTSGENKFRTLQGALDDAATQGFDETDNILFRVEGTGTAFITKKHGNYKFIIKAVNGANISYANYVPLGGDLAVVEGHLPTTDDRKAQNLKFEYETDGIVIFGNSAGDALDFGRGADITIKANKLEGLDNFTFSRLQQINVDVNETEWNSSQLYANNIAGLADSRYLKSIVNLGNITINTATSFELFSIGGNHAELHWESITSTSLTGLLAIQGVNANSNIRKYSIGSVNTPNLTTDSYIVNTNAELEINIDNVDTWSNRVHLDYAGNDNVVFTGKGDFSASTTNLARYHLHFKNADITLNYGVITNNTGNSKVPLTLENSIITYSNYLVARSGTPATYTLPNFLIKGYCHIIKTGASASIFANLDPATDYDQSIEIDGKLTTFNCTFKDEINATVVDNVLEESGKTTGIITEGLSKSSTITTSRNALITDVDGVNESTASSNVTINIQPNATLAFDNESVLMYRQAGSGIVIVNYNGTEIGRTAGVNTNIVVWQDGIDNWEILSQNNNLTTSSSPLVFKTIIDGYNLLPEDNDNIILYYDGVSDITININTDAISNFTENILVKTYSKGTGKTRINYLTGVTGELVKTASNTRIMSIARNGANNWIPIDGFEAYTIPQLYTELNVLNVDNETNALTGLTSNGGATLTNLLSNLSNTTYMARITNVGGGQQSMRISQSGLTIGNTYEFIFNVQSSMGFGTLVNSVSGTNYTSQGFNNTSETTVAITIIPTSTTVTLEIGWSTAGVDGATIDVESLIINDVTI